MSEVHNVKPKLAPFFSKNIIIQLIFSFFDNLDILIMFDISDLGKLNINLFNYRGYPNLRGCR